jgi:hypothetical protein
VIEEFAHLMSDPAHLAFEVATTLIIEGIGFGLAWPFIKRKVRKHDREAHGVRTDDN